MRRRGAGGGGALRAAVVGALACVCSGAAAVPGAAAGATAATARATAASAGASSGAGGGGALRLMAEAEAADASGRPREALRLAADAVEAARDAGPDEVALATGTLRRLLARVGGEPVAGPGPGGERFAAVGARWAALQTYDGTWRLAPIVAGAAVSTDDWMGDSRGPSGVDRRFLVARGGESPWTADLDSERPLPAPLPLGGNAEAVQLVLSAGGGAALIVTGGDSGTLSVVGGARGAGVGGSGGGRSAPALTLDAPGFGGAWAVAAAPGVRVMAGGSHGELWSWALGARGAEVEVGPRVEVARLPGAVRAVTLDASGELAAIEVDGETCRVALVDLAQRRPRTILLPEGSCDALRQQLVVGGDGLVVLVGESGAVRVALTDERSGGGASSGASPSRDASARLAVVRDASWGRAVPRPRAVAVAPDVGFAALVRGRETDIEVIELWSREDLAKKAGGGEPAPTLLRGHTGPVRALVALPGPALLSAGDDGTIRRWAPRGDGAWVTTVVLRGHEGPVRDLVVAPGGVVLSLGGDGVRRWRLDAGPGASPLALPLDAAPTGAPASSLVPAGTPPSGEVPGLALQAGQVVAAAGGPLRTWTLASGEGVPAVEGLLAAPSVAVAPALVAADGRVALLTNGAQATLLDLRSAPPAERALALPAAAGPLTTVAASPDGRWVAAVGQGGLLLWDLKAPPEIAPRVVAAAKDPDLPDGEPVPVDGRALRFDPASRRLAVLGTTPWLLDLAAGTQAAPVRAAALYSTTAVDGAFTPDGRHLLLALEAGHRMTGTTGVMLVDAERRDLDVGPLLLEDWVDPANDEVGAFAASPDGRWLLWATTARPASLVDLRGVDLAARVDAERERRAREAEADAAGAEREPDEGQAPSAALPATALQAHRAAVVAAAFDRASAHLVTGDRVGEVWAWDLRAPDPGAHAAHLASHGDDVGAVAVDPTGRVAASAGRDGTVQVSLLGAEDLVALARHVAGPVVAVEPAP